MGASDPPITFRHREMMDALHLARAAVDRPLSDSERHDGWNENVLGWVRSWLDDCEAHLSKTPHPLPRMHTTWTRNWDEVPGKAFDPSTSDERKDAILEASNQVTWVLNFDELWRRVTDLIEQLGSEHRVAEFGVSHDVADGVLGCLTALHDRLATDRPISDDEISAWQQSLTPFGAKWVDSSGRLIGPADQGVRFWQDQPGALWTSLAPIVRSFSSGIDWTCWIVPLERDS